MDSECLMTSMQYALDANGSWANAKLTQYKKHSQFFCGCAERHSVKLVKPSGSHKVTREKASSVLRRVWRQRT